MNTAEIVELDYFRAVASVFVTFVLEGIFVNTELPDELETWGKGEDYRFLLKILLRNTRFIYPQKSADISSEEAAERYARGKVVHSAFDGKTEFVSCLNNNSHLLEELLNAGNVESHWVFEQQKHRMNFISKMGELINKIKPYCTNSSATRHALDELAKIEKKYRCSEMDD